METLKKKFVEKATPLVEQYKNLVKDKGDVVIGQYTIGQVLTGMKGISALLTCTSKLDPHTGITFRGYTIPELREKLPKMRPEGEPLPEGLFYLMLVNEIPTREEAMELSKEWALRSQVPKHVFDIIDELPKNSRPMTQFSAAILALATESTFQKAYRAGLNKKDYWDTTFEDAMNLIARLPRIAAYIYRKQYYDNVQIEPNPKLDWAANFAHMMGYNSDEIYRLFRLYMFLHADHEGGNVSAHATHLVGSTLSNVYYSYAAGMLGLAGPLHGYANQEVINWISKMLEQLNTDSPTNEQIAKYVQETLLAGQVVPGYGHAVLRITDPRFTAQQEFAKKYIVNDNLINVVNQLNEVVPPILSTVGKIKNPWPNVDAFSGALLMHYGIREHTFYTVLFGVSRALGVLASIIWDRAYGLPIERPASQTLSYFQNIADAAENKS